MEIGQAQNASRIPTTSTTTLSTPRDLSDSLLVLTNNDQTLQTAQNAERCSPRSTPALPRDEALLQAMLRTG